MITRSRSGPALPALLTLYKSLVRSSIDYGLIVYGSASKSLLAELDKVQNIFLRLMLGSLPSTPVSELRLETGIEPTHLRALWLSSNFVLKINDESSNPIAKFTSNMRKRTVKHRPRSTPCLAEAIQLTQDLNLSPSSLEPTLQSPPWTADNLTSHFLHISKSSAAANPLEANSIFLEFYNSLPTNSISVFCDGSCSPALERSSAAFLIPNLNVSRSWTLVPGSSILSAELSAIDSSLSFLYRAHEVYESVFVFSDSKSAIQLLSSNCHSHPIAFNALNTINLLKVRGISVSLVWIPSHVGIHFNEQVDTLARQEVISPSVRFENQLSLSEKLLVVKHKLQSQFHADIHRFPSFHAQHRKKIGPAPYFNAPSRRTSVALHRLRSGHNHLNGHRFKFDPDCQSPNCRHGCIAQENARHVLLDCPFFDHERHPLRLLFTRLNLPFTLENVLCFNDSIPKNSLLNIRYALSSFLIASKLISIV